MNQRRKLERHHVSSSMEVYDLDSGQLLGRVVDLHTEGLMLLSEQPIELERSWVLQVNLPMTLNGLNEFFLDADSLWSRASITGGQYWTGLQFSHLPEESRQCIERMISSQ